MEKKQVEKIIEQYIAAFNQSKVEALITLFTEDAVVMAPNAPTVAGLEQLKNFLGYGFSLVKMDAKIEFDEVVIHGANAYVRTHSKVNVTDLKTGVTQPEEDRELFLLRNENGNWKIARYIFNKMPSGH